MRGKTRAHLPLAIVLGLLAITVPTQVMAAGDGVTINEIRVDQTGADNDEYFELSGPAGQSLDGFTYLVIGDGTVGGSGVIEAVVSLDGQTIAADGFFLVSETTLTLGTPDLTVGSSGLNFENSDNVTHLLVQGFIGADGADLDTNDDGVLDTTPWASIVDSVALVGSAPGDRVYSPTVVGPDGTFVPGHIYDCADGWLIGPFDPTVGDDTPGADNSVCPATPEDVFIHDVQGPGASTPLPGAFVRVEGVVVGDFQGNSFAGTQLGGFFLQEEPADHDADPNTSEGVFVSAPSAPEVAVGDVVSIIGVAAEASGKTQIGNVTGVAIIGSDPGAVLATPVSLPVTAPSDWEKYEGMLVSFDQDLFISEYFNFDRFNEIVLSTDRQYQGTQVAAPGARGQCGGGGQCPGPDHPRRWAQQPEPRPGHPPQRGGIHPDQHLQGRRRPPGGDWGARLRLWPVPDTTHPGCHLHQRQPEAYVAGPDPGDHQGGQLQRAELLHPPR